MMGNRVETNRQYPAKLKTIEKVGASLFKVKLVVPDSFSFLAGQYIWLQVNNSNHAFSITNAPNTTGCLELLLKKSDSAYKKALFDLPINSDVTVLGPFGSSFTLTDIPAGATLVLIAGGTGVSAFLSLLKFLSQNKQEQRSVCLVYLTASDDQAVELEFFKTLTKNSWFNFIHSTELFSIDLLDKLPIPEPTWYFISGPQNFVNYITPILVDHGASPSNFRFEQFYPQPETSKTLDRLLSISEAVQTILAGSNELDQRVNIFKAATNSSSNHIVITDIDGVIKYANTAAQQITGFSFAEMQGNTPRLWGGLMSPEYYKNLWTTKLSGKPFIGEITNRRKNGELYTAIVHISPILSDATGKILGFLATEEDISHEKQIQEQLRESDERWQFALEGAGDGVWDWDVPSGKVFFSKRWKSMLGYEDNEIANTLAEWEKRVVPEDLAHAEKALADHFSGQTPVYISEQRIFSKDGTIKWILDRGKVVSWTDDGKPKRMVGTHTDITNRKATELALGQLKTRLELAAKVAELGVWELDINTNNVTWDGNMFSMHGSQSSDTIIKFESWLEKLVADDVKLFKQTIHACITQGTPIHMTYRFKTKDKTVKFILTSAIRVNNPDEPYKLVGASRDITLETEIDRAKTEFVSLASHQLRTPLTVINWYTEMLLSDQSTKLTKLQVTNLTQIAESSKKLTTLVNALLNTARIELGTIAVQPKLCQLTSILETELKELYPLIKHKNITLTQKPAKLPLILLDENLVRIIYQNLLTNAIKYTPKSGRITISHSIDTASKNVVIKISDTGIGIAKEHQAKIFAKLFRAPNAIKHDDKGNGLGLYIVKAIVELVGGNIDFTSELAKGTTFFVTLPISGMQVHKGSKTLE